MRRVLHQRVLEAVDRVGRRAALEHQLGSDEAGERGLQLVLGKAGDGTQQRVGKLASDRGADLRHLPHRRQAVEPRHQRRRAASSGWRTAAARRRARSGPPPRAAGRSPGRSWSIPRQTAARRRCDRRSGRRPHRATPCHRRSASTRAVRSRRSRRLSASIADLRLAGPGRLELGAERHDQQHRQAADPLDDEVEQLARGRVDPMRVLEDHDHRLLARQAFELPDQRLQCPFLLALRTEVRQRVAFRSRQ